VEIFHEKAIFDRTVYMTGMTEMPEVSGVDNYVNFKSTYIYCLIYQPWCADIFGWGQLDKLLFRDTTPLRNSKS